MSKMTTCECCGASRARGVEAHDHTGIASCPSVVSIYPSQLVCVDAACAHLRCCLYMNALFCHMSGWVMDTVAVEVDESSEGSDDEIQELDAAALCGVDAMPDDITEETYDQLLKATNFTDALLTGAEQRTCIWSPQGGGRGPDASVVPCGPRSSYLSDGHVIARLMFCCHVYQPVENPSTPSKAKTEVADQPVLVEDFIRNYLVQMGLNKTLEAFQSEWYQLKAQGRLESTEDSSFLPDVYAHNQRMEERTQELRRELERWQKVAGNVRETWDKLRKERDFHRMHHRRVKQEKERLMKDLRSVTRQTDASKKAYKDVEDKYKSVLKENTLLQIECTRIVNHARALEDALQSLNADTTVLKTSVDNLTSAHMRVDRRNKSGKVSARLRGTGGKTGSGPSTARTGDKSAGSSLKRKDTTPTATTAKAKGNAAKFNKSRKSKDEAPARKKVPSTYSGMYGQRGSKTDDGKDDAQQNMSDGSMTDIQPAEYPEQPLANPYRQGLAILEKMEAEGNTGSATTAIPEVETPFKQRVPLVPAPIQSFGPTAVFQAHDMTVVDIALHPESDVLITASDDATWKMWSIPSGERIMTGEGHTTWLSSCRIHPFGTHLATTSGDCSVKFWDFQAASCSATVHAHGQPVLGCDFHYTGDFLATASHDTTGRILDLCTGKVRTTIRGHSDAVNDVEWVPGMNILATCSGDKTVSFWDAKSGNTTQTLFSHDSAVSDIAFSRSAVEMASADMSGVVKVWDIRMMQEVKQIEVGPAEVTGVTFDHTGRVVAVASRDKTCKVFNIRENRHVRDFMGHEDSVEAVLFNYNGHAMYTCSADNTFRIWS